MHLDRLTAQPNFLEQGHLMKLRLPVAITLIAFILSLSTVEIPVSAADPTCNTTNETNYSVTLCISAPADEAVVSGNVWITITRSTTGLPPPVDRVIATLNGKYLLTDYVPHYRFKLPTAHFVDGDYVLRIEEHYDNDDETEETAIDLTFQNGVLTPPVNTKTFTPHVPNAPSDSPVLVAAIGDSASGERPQITDMVRNWKPQMLLYLGDVYNRGTYTEFINWYKPYLGALRGITNPVVGNHEYDNGDGAAGYFFYWNNVPHYYSYDVGNWHIVALDSTDDFDQLEPGTDQYDWLVQDLSASTRPCTMVTMHHPPLAVGRAGVNTSVGEHLWPLFVSEQVDVVMVGHAHQYQRWHPVDANGNIAQNAPVLIVNGTGGHHVDPFEDTDSRIAVGYDEESEAYGAMKLKLHPDRMKFKFINEFGTLLDSGNIPCHGIVKPPTPPVLVSPAPAAQVPDASPIFVWSENPASENVIHYKLVVVNPAGKKVFVQKISAESCDGACTFDIGSTAFTLRNKSYTWYVQAKNEAGKTKSEVRTIHIEAATN
jgi:hypothetical protein